MLDKRSWPLSMEVASFFHPQTFVIKWTQEETTEQHQYD